jgi:uncharacterized glyoxalase superfamily protein PhnB
MRTPAVPPQLAEASMVQPVPVGYHSVTPYLMVRDAARAIMFYRNAFGADEVMRFGGPDGRIAHAEVKIGDSHVMPIGTHREDVSVEEMQRRMASMASQKAG